MDKHDREANRRYQATWRKKHFALHGELVRIVGQLAAAPAMLDKLDNPKLASKIRKALEEISDDLT